MNRSRILNRVLIAALSIISLIPIYEFNNFFLRPIPRSYRQVTVVSIDYQSGKNYWLTWIQVRNANNEVSTTPIPSEDIGSLAPGSKILLMSGDWDLKRKYEQKVTLRRLASAYHAYILLFAPIWLLFLLLRFLARRYRA